ncbi:MAG: hypothetical protein UU24_C0034G0009 [Candidatus Nomurabacteria bacterium GW2011_GWA2_40_9]|uniref:Uncharacterized protein n=1 Tax=Candidatus Nomurabacteria bacterium GW2011_GWA2_40_9 TaxID=1618734 RepID=A0A0G0W2I4_9BACT|nr:MAG: hypothetical protein UU24_C0034G0009 [Candidatus Nomurabacteria bacterium GW2011_GWA2_40_9]
MSHIQIQSHLQDVFNFHVSIGEISNILETEANDLRPQYQGLKDSVVSQKGTHYDETSLEICITEYKNHLVKKSLLETLSDQTKDLLWF